MEVVIIACAIGVASYSAIAIDYVAQNNLGIPLKEIRGTSLLIAIILGAVLAVDFFGRKGKPK